MDKVIREGVVRVGVDLAKHVIQVHAVNTAGRVLTSRALARDKFVEWCVMLPAVHCNKGLTSGLTPQLMLYSPQCVLQLSLLNLRIDVLYVLHYRKVVTSLAVLWRFKGFDKKRF